MDKIETRGGSRPGSGRKSAAQEDKRVQISISVSPKTQRRIEELRTKKVKVGRLVDELISRYCAESE